MNPDFTLIWPLSCPKDGDHFCQRRCQHTHDTEHTHPITTETHDHPIRHTARLDAKAVNDQTCGALGWFAERER